MSQPTVVQQLANLAVRTRLEGLPADLDQDVQNRFLDVIGNCLYARDESSGQAAAAVVAGWGGSDESTIIGGAGAPAHAAALVNGTLAHSMDFDDTHLPSVLHPSSSVIPAALAVAESAGASGAQLLDAAGVGIEIAIRTGMGGYNVELGNSIFFDRGFHATSICGALGSAASAAMLLDLDEERIAHAIGIAASMGAGLIEANRTGGTVKRMHCGWAAQSGVVAAQLAAAGLTGPPTVIEGRFGFLNAYCGSEAVPAHVTDRLGKHWELPGVFFKPYPCNHFTHAGIDAALELRARGVNVEEIEDLELGLPEPVMRTIAEPREEKVRPESGYHAAFSGPYTVAAALIGGGGLGLGHADFTDEVAGEERRLALAAKVRCVADEDCGAIFPMQFPAVLTATLHDGRRESVRIDANRGGPQQPLSREELATKFRLNAIPVLGEDGCEVVVRAALALSDSSDVRELTKQLRY